MANLPARPHAVGARRPIDRRSHRLSLALLTAVLASCGTAAPTPPPPSASPDTTRAALPTPPLAAGVLKLVAPGFNPSGLLYAGGSLWAEDHSNRNNLYKLDAATGAVKAEIDLRRPCDMAEGFGSIWVADLEGGQVLRLDPDTGQTTATVEVADPCGPQIAGGAVWVAVDGGMAKIDPEHNAVIATVGKVGMFPGAGGTPLWASEGDSGRLLKVDAKTARVIGEAQLAHPVDFAGVLVANGRLWTSNRMSGEIQEFDARTGREIATIPVEGPDRMTLLDGTLWVTSYSRGRVYAIDTESREITFTLELGGNANGIAVTPAGIWVADTMGRLALVDPGAA